MDSIVSEFFRHGISEIIFSGKSLKLKKALLELSKKNNISLKIIPITYKTLFPEIIFERTRPLWLKHTFILLCKALAMTLRTLHVKKSFIFSAKKKARVKGNTPIMIITPYPDFDETLAKQGVFKNKYFVHLQEALKKGNERVAWISMYARNNAILFSESLRYAKRFVKNGDVFFMLEEFNLIRNQILAFRKMLVNAVKFLFLKKRIRDISDFGNFNAFVFFEDDWYSSFAGFTGYYGLVSYYTFMNLFNSIRPVKCLFPCEMRAWEKALIAAGSGAEKKITFFASQAGTVPKMHVNLFNHPDELNKDVLYPMPQADKILCNGALSLRYLSESGWRKEKMYLVEALRYMYLKEIVTRNFSSQKQKIVVLLLSISPEESSPLLSACYEAFEDMKKLEIWIKPHPFLNLDKAFYLAGVPKESMKFKVKQELLKDLLPEALIAVTGESSSAVEALAFGCRVLVVKTPEWINLSPLRFVDTDIVDIVSSSEELKQKTMDIFEQWDLDSRLRGNDKKGRGDDNERYKEEKRVVNEFFCLNAETDVPEKFLTVLNNKS